MLSKFWILNSNSISNLTKWFWWLVSFHLARLILSLEFDAWIDIVHSLLGSYGPCLKEKCTNHSNMPIYPSGRWTYNFLDEALHYFFFTLQKIGRLAIIWILNNWISAVLQQNLILLGSECETHPIRSSIVTCNLPLTAHISWMALHIISCPGYHQWRVRMGQLHLLSVLI